MILEHYSKKPLAWPPRNRRQTYYKEGWGWPMKPEGLWVSVKGENDWPWWCEAEGFRTEHLAVCTRVILSDEANIRVVSGEEQLIAFDEQYGVDWRLGDSGFTSRRIDWVRVARDYDGIIIAPYVWECRLPCGDRGSERQRVSDWYYSWDVASGCIWHGTKAIAAFEQAERQQEEAA